MPDSFKEKLKAKWDEGKFVCVGLDSDYSKLPHSFKTYSKEESLFNFNKSIIDQTFDLVCAYKINTAFYESEGSEGWKALEETCKYLKENYSDILIILDAKRADIGNTNQKYAQAFFDNLKADAITINPYPGKEAFMPFLEYKDKGIIIWLGASNPGTDKFQDLLVGESQVPLYQVIAEQITDSWNHNGNCAVVVGGTYPEQLKKVREIVGDMPILVPGIGEQGGDLEATIKNGLDSNKQGLIISSSRGIIFASSGDNFAEKAREAAEELHKKIKEILA